MNGGFAVDGKAPLQLPHAKAKALRDEAESLSLELLQAGEATTRRLGASNSCADASSAAAK